MLKQDFRCLFQTRTLSEESCWRSRDAGGRLGIDQQGFLNVFLERRRAGRGAVNLEDDHHSTNKDWKPGLWLRRADGGAKTLEDEITLPTRILVSASSPRESPPLHHPEPDLHLLTQSQTSTSCQKSSRTAEGEAERLGTGGLWCQGGPETEAGDQGPAAPDQRVTITKLI
ncbi:unnamed protein product [Boreogadus saida]